MFNPIDQTPHGQISCKACPPKKIIVDAATSCNTRTKILFSHLWQLVSNDVSSHFIKSTAMFAKFKGRSNFGKIGLRQWAVRIGLTTSFIGFDISSLSMIKPPKSLIWKLSMEKSTANKFFFCLLQFAWTYRLCKLTYFGHISCSVE